MYPAESERLRRGERRYKRTGARAFSILINANNELFSVWLGARGSAVPRATTTPGPTYSCTNDRCPPPFAESRSTTHPATPRQQPIAPATPRDSPGRQSSCGFDWDKYEPRYRFRWDTCPFFFLHRALSIADFPPGSPTAISSLLLPFSFSPLSHSFSLFVTNSRN